MANLQNKKILYLYKNSIFLLILFIVTASPQYSQHQRRGKQVAGRNYNHNSSQSDGKISVSQTIKLMERDKFKQVSENVPGETKFKEFIFTIQGVQQFLVNLPVAQQVAFSLFSYVLQQNSYIRPLNIDQQAPIKVYVFQNNNRIVHQSDFYFQNYVVFDGQQGSTYTIRFINSGTEKLITMNLKKVTELNHVEKAANREKVSQFDVKANRLSQQLNFLFNSFKRYSLINQHSLKALLSNLNIYFYWQLFQSLIAFLVCVFQIFYIKKLCKCEIIV